MNLMADVKYVAEDHLFSDAMDRAADVFHSTQYGMRKNADKAGEELDGERAMRRCLAAAIDTFNRECATDKHAHPERLQRVRTST